MAGIDAAVVLGLAGKVARVFTKEDHYLAFPTGPIGWKVDSLRSIITDPLSPSGAKAHAEFSITVNKIPNGPVWQPTGEVLWDVYGDVLSTAMVELLERPRPKSAKKAYDKAFALLYHQGADGIPVPSETVAAYERYRDAYLAASIEYNNRKGEAELSADQAVKVAWAEDEPRLRAAVEDAEVGWNGPGSRAKVDAARQLINDYGSDSPSAVWTSLRALFDPNQPEVFFRSTLDSETYVPTGYLPSDVLNMAWPRITVRAEEFQRLGNQAPEELRGRLGGDDDAGIELVTFEYSFVTVHRPWHTPAVYASRAWRFRDPGRKLSDGGSPPKGECTAYVTGLVLARNITVRRIKAATDTEPLELGFLPTKPLASQVNLGRMYTLDDLERRIAARAAVSDHRTGARPVVRDHRTAPTPQRSAAPAGGLAKLTVSRGPLIAGKAIDVARLSSAYTSARSDAAKLGTRKPAPPPRSESTEMSTDPDEIFVLALECRYTPKSPDPDSALSGVSPTTEARKYTVAKGDSLAKIASRFYGDRSQWRQIYEANRKVIGDDPAVIKPGQKLTIP